MGISGLLPALKPAQTSVTLNRFRGQRVAVDTYVWLHKGAFSCAAELCLNEGPTRRFITAVFNQINVLRSYDITPVLVFDGGNLPMKSGTDAKRREARRENLAKAFRFKKAGKKTLAYEHFQRCAGVTPHMAFQLIQELRANDIEFIVAPYEADAQLCYLEKIGFVSAIITEDSDLMAFGCQKIITKLKKDGHAQLVDRSRFSKVKIGAHALKSWDDTRFLHMCILSGCDYLDSIYGMGIKMAAACVGTFDTIDDVFDKAFVIKPTFKFSDEYRADFRRAVLTFRHQRVYDPVKDELTYLNPIDDDTLADADFIGAPLDPETARGIARGVLNPVTKETYRVRAHDPDRAHPDDVKAYLEGRMPEDEFIRKCIKKCDSGDDQGKENADPAARKRKHPDAAPPPAVVHPDPWDPATNGGVGATLAKQFHYAPRVRVDKENVTAASSAFFAPRDDIEELDADKENVAVAGAAPVAEDAPQEKHFFQTFIDNENSKKRAAAAAAAAAVAADDAKQKTRLHKPAPMRAVPAQDAKSNSAPAAANATKDDFATRFKRSVSGSAAQMTSALRDMFKARAGAPGVGATRGGSRPSGLLKPGAASAAREREAKRQKLGDGQMTMKQFM